MPDDNPLVEGDRQEPEHFSTIFQRLVNGPDDLVGLVAYGLYKESKRDWTLRYRRKHGHRPAEVALEEYHDTFSDSDLQRLRSEAEELMLAFADTIVEARRPEIERQALDRGLADTERRIVSEIAARTRFRDGLYTSLTAWFISVVVIIGAILLTNYRAVWGAIKQALGIS